MYDAVVVLALKLDSNWKLTDDIKARLDHAAELFNAKQTKQIVLSGKWSIWFDWLRLTPPVTEAGEMKLYLESKGIPRTAILIDESSKDTIGNIYELSILVKSELYKDVAVICAEQHLGRVRFLCGAFMDKGTHVSYIPIRSPHFAKETTGDEDTILAEQQHVVADLLVKLKDNPRYAIYDHPYYTKQAKLVEKLLRTNSKLRRVSPALAPDIADQ